MRQQLQHANGLRRQSASLKLGIHFSKEVLLTTLARVMRGVSDIGFWEAARSFFGLGEAARSFSKFRIIVVDDNVFVFFGYRLILNQIEFFGTALFRTFLEGEHN